MRLQKRRMQPRVEREGLLDNDFIRACCTLSVKDEVPAVLRHRARNGNEEMVGEQLIAKGLLAGAWNARNQPVRVWDFGTSDYTYHCGVEDLQGRQHMGDGIKRLEAFVYGHLQNRCRGIKRAIDRTPSLAVPATTNPIGALATVPGPSKGRRIEAPGQEIAATERRGQGGHA